MSDLSNAGAEPANEISLRDELAAAFATTTPEPAAPEAPQETEAEAAERARDERGRFAAKAPDAPETAAKPPETGKEQPPAETPEAEPTEATRPSGPPPGWSVAAKAAFDTLPAEVRAAVAKREEEIDRGFAKLKDYKTIEATHGASAQRYGVSVPEFIKRLADGEEFLKTKPVEAIQWLAQTYNIDLSRLSGTAAPAQGQQPQQPAADPNIAPLLQEINNLNQTIYGDKAAQINNQVEQFFTDPKNKYSENVADQMVVLINEAKRTGQPVDLSSIYNDACWMNPEVRAALIKEQTVKQQSDAAAKARQTANQARQAGASITGGPAVTPPPVSPDLDLRSTLEAAWASSSGRA